jgi:hypothetical protein
LLYLKCHFVIPVTLFFTQVQKVAGQLGVAPRGGGAGGKSSNVVGNGSGACGGPGGKVGCGKGLEKKSKRSGKAGAAFPSSSSSEEKAAIVAPSSSNSPSWVPHCTLGKIKVPKSELGRVGALLVKRGEDFVRSGGCGGGGGVGGTPQKDGGVRSRSCVDSGVTSCTSGDSAEAPVREQDQALSAMEHQARNQSGELQNHSQKGRCTSPVLAIEAAGLQMGGAIPKQRWLDWKMPFALV